MGAPLAWLGSAREGAASVVSALRRSPHPARRLRLSAPCAARREGGCAVAQPRRHAEGRPVSRVDGDGHRTAGESRRVSVCALRSNVERCIFAVRLPSVRELLLLLWLLLSVSSIFSSLMLLLLLQVVSSLSGVSTLLPLEVEARRHQRKSLRRHARRGVWWGARRPQLPAQRRRARRGLLEGRRRAPQRGVARDTRWRSADRRARGEPNSGRHPRTCAAGECARGAHVLVLLLLLLLLLRQRV